jgi:hypothetical protein
VLEATESMDSRVEAAARQDARALRWLLGSGVAFAVAQLGVLLYFGAAVASKWPPRGAPAAERVAHFAHDWEQINLGNFLLPLPTPLFLLFLGGMYGALRRGEGGSGALSAAAFAGGVATALVWPIGMVIGQVAMDIGRQGGDPVTMQVLEGAAPLTLALSALPRAALLAAASGVVLRGGVAPRWIGWLGAVLVPVTLAGTATLLTPAAFPLAALGMLLFLAWVGALSAGALRGVRASVAVEGMSAIGPAVGPRTASAVVALGYAVAAADPAGAANLDPEREIPS